MTHDKTVLPARSVGGTVEVPADKSISHRAVILGALSNRTCRVENFLSAEDCLRTVEAFRQMGVTIEQAGSQLMIHGVGLEGLKKPTGQIQCGNSGTTARLLMGVLTGHPFVAEFVGDLSLSGRPMDRVVEPLGRMGADFWLDTSDPPSHWPVVDSPGKWNLPFMMRGSRNVRSVDWKSLVASAQVKSAILLAGLYASGATTIEEPSLSRDHTERMLKASGVLVERQGLRVTVRGTATIRASEFYVPGDLSSAAFFLAAGLLKAESGLTVRAVGVNPTRSGFLDVIKTMGGECREDNVTERGGEPVADITVKASRLQATTISGELIPRLIDEIPILAVLATQAHGQTVISDAKELRVKESDRIATLCEELSKMGARISEKPDGMIIDGPTPLHRAPVGSHGDHRLAMSLAIAALVADASIVVQNVACVNTSFPNFWALLEKIGAKVHDS